MKPTMRTANRIVTLPVRRWIKGLLLMVSALAGASLAQGQTLPPNSVFQAGVTYGSTYGIGTNATGIGTGNANGGYFGNGQGKLFDVVVTNSTGSGPSLYVFEGNGDGSFEQPFPSVYKNVNDGLDKVFVGPVFGPGGNDMIVTDDFGFLYTLQVSEGFAGTPVPIGVQANVVTPFINNEGTLDLAISQLSFPGGKASSQISVLHNNGNGTFTTVNVTTVANQVSWLVFTKTQTLGGSPTLFMLCADGTGELTLQLTEQQYSATVPQSYPLPAGFSQGTLTGLVSAGAAGLAGIATSSTSSATSVFVFSKLRPDPTTNGFTLGSTVALPTANPPSSYPATIVPADINDDGLTDLVVLGGGSFSTAQTADIFLQNNDGSFTESGPTIGPGVYGSQVVVGDVNNDGHADLVFYDQVQGITVLLNQGNGTFLLPASNVYSPAPGSKAMARGDLNGDGFDDLAVVTNNNQVQVILNNLQGNGAPFSTSTIGVGQNPIAVSIAMANGKPSLFVLNQTDKTVTFLQGNGDATYETATRTAVDISAGLTQFSNPASLGIVANGNAPILVIGDTAGGIATYVSTGAASWKLGQTFSTGANNFSAAVNSIASADMDGDGNLDIVFALRGQCGYNISGLNTLTGGAVGVLLGKGNGTFQAPTLINSTAANSDPGLVVLGHLGTGNLPDILAVDAGGGSCAAHNAYPFVLFNTSAVGKLSFSETDITNQFTAPASFNQSIVPLQAAIADVNGDGKNDIVVSSQGLVGAFVSNGDGTFMRPSIYVGGTDSAALVAGSFFAKGAHDVALAGAAGQWVLKSTQKTVSTGAPIATYNPTTLNFGNVPVGQAPTLVLTVENTGTDVLNLPIFNSFSAPTAFSTTEVVCGTEVNPASIGQLVPGQSCAITFAFAPTATGQQSTTIYFDDNAAQSNAPNQAGGVVAYAQSITLTGNGTAALAADLALSESGPATATVGQQVSYIFTIQNNGPNTANSVTLKNVLPAQLTFVSATNGCANSSGTVQCNLGNIASGSSAKVTVTATANAAATITNTGTVSSATNDPNSANNTASAQTVISAQGGGGGGVGCICSKTGNYVNPAAGVAPVAAGSSPHGKYTLTATQNGGQAQLQVTKGNTTVFNQSYSVSGTNTATWGFSPDDDRFVVTTIQNGVQTIYLYDLTAALSAPILSTGGVSLAAAGSNQSPSQVLFSPSGKYLLFEALTGATTTEFWIYNSLTGKLVYDSLSLSTAILSDNMEHQDGFGLVAFGFSADSPETSFVYAYVSGQTSVNWDVVPLASVNKVSADGTITISGTTTAFFQYSPCGDIVALVQQPSQNSIDVTLYQAVTGKQLANNSNLAFGNITLSSTATEQQASVLTTSGTQTTNLVANTGCSAPNTPVGSSITVVAQDQTNPSTSPVTVEFSNVSQAGATVVTTSSTGPATPAGFELVTNPPTYFEISTTAMYSGNITVCINYGALGLTLSQVQNLQFLHFVNGQTPGVAAATSVTGSEICATVTSLSPFVLADAVVANPAVQLAVTGSSWATDSSGNYVATVTVTNNGNITAVSTGLSAASVTAVVGGKAQVTAAKTSLPLSLGFLLPGGSQSFSVTFPSTAGAPGAAAALKLSFSFQGGTAGSTLRATLP